MPEYADDVAFARDVLDGRDLVTAFVERLTDAGGLAFVDPRALGAWLVDRGARRGHCDPSLVEALRPALPAGIAVETRFERARIDDYDFAITRAAGAIAETGTIVLGDATTSHRLAALAPWIHVAVVGRSTIVARVVDALRAAGSDANVVWCTGPSKTADVEGILVRGVHGPGEQVALVVP
ncbi:MAG TPA: LUD domain-containing protein [Polyangiaceae bacterium]|nr:LUD domain-containing protein [Polyangiaceae bacterium]